MGVSKELLAAKTSVRKLTPIANKLDELNSYIGELSGLVDDDVLTQSEITELQTHYKDSIKEYVNEIITEDKAHAEEIEESAQIEANDKVKNITTVISGQPVITPPPPTYVIANATSLSKKAILVAQVSSLATRIIRALS